MSGNEWMRVGVKAALKEQRADEAERRFERVEAGECAGFKERWRTKAVVGARRLPSGGVMVMVEWPNPAHVDSEVRLINLTADERRVAHLIVFSRLHAKKVALAAVRAVVARAAAASSAEREALGLARRRCSRLAEGAAGARDGPAGTVVADIVRESLARRAGAAAAGTQTEGAMEVCGVGDEAMEDGVAGRRSGGAPGSEGQGSDGAVESEADRVTGISEVRNGRAGPEALVRRGAESEDEEMAGTAMEEWVAVSSLPKGWRALARRMLREAGLAIGKGAAGRRESARRAVTAPQGGGG